MIDHAVQKLIAAREQVVRIAADWQARGIDTAPLTEPLITMQEGIAALEAAAGEERFRSLTRELRDHFDAVRAAGAGLETEASAAHRLRWLDLIERSADRCIETVNRLEPLMCDG